MKTIALLAAALTAALSGTCATNETTSAFTPYAWRGFMLDEARHFFGKEKVKEIIDLMAEHKMNVFHWHLTDDQGWRIDLPGLPELVRAGAVRPCSPPPSRHRLSVPDALPPYPHSGTPPSCQEAHCHPFYY